MKSSPTLFKKPSLITSEQLHVWLIPMFVAGDDPRQ